MICLSQNNRIRTAATTIGLAVLLSPMCSLAEDEYGERKLAPYEKVALVFDRVMVEPGLEALLQAVVDAVSERDADMLQPLVDRSFFWEADHGGGYDPQASAFDNFRTALRLTEDYAAPDVHEHHWSNLRRLVLAPSFGAHGQRPGTVCSFAEPYFSAPEKAYDIFDTFYSDHYFEWVYADGLAAVYADAGFSGEPVMWLEDEAVFMSDVVFTGDVLMGYEVALPNGARAYGSARELISFLDERLCFSADEQGKWAISGYSGGGD